LLKKEFGVPFAFYEATTGARVWSKDHEEVHHAPAELALIALTHFVQEGQAVARMQANHQFQLMLLVYECGQPALVALGELPALSQNVPEMAQEQVRTERWLQAVADRLRQADQFMSRHRDNTGQEAQVKTAWETILRIDHLLRRLRIHKEPGRNQRRILQSAYEMLGVQTLVWVPHPANDAVLSQGDACMSAWDYRQLAVRISQLPDLQPSGLFLCNEVQATSWGGRFPRIVNLLALPVSDQGSLGWIIAINKKDGSRPSFHPEKGKPLSSPDIQLDLAVSAPPPVHLAAFRRSDAAILTPFAALLDLHVRSSGRYRDLQDLLVGLARSLTSAIDAKDSYTYGHSERVARIAVELGRELGLQEEELSDVFLAGLLHDIGKIGIRDAVLSKVEPLTSEEFEHIKQHVTIGYSILQNLRPINHLLPGVRNHHERYDGQGYPDGLAGEDIPLLARILAVADSYDAMTTSRPYRNAMSVPQVEEILSQGAGSQWDRRVIEAFQACRQKIHGIRQRGVGESLRHALDDALRTNDSAILPNLLSSPNNGNCVR
jgi:putative nucleotidyltransferase with HDIG domain